MDYLSSALASLFTDAVGCAQPRERIYITQALEDAVVRPTALTTDGGVEGQEVNLSASPALESPQVSATHSPPHPSSLTFLSLPERTGTDEGCSERLQGRCP